MNRQKRRASGHGVSASPGYREHRQSFGVCRFLLSRPPFYAMMKEEKRNENPLLLCLRQVKGREEK